MNKNSKFHSLSPEDRQQILRWCEQSGYEEVVEKCALPRPEGLALQTSVSAVQRFYASYSPLCYDGDILVQCAKAVQSNQIARDPELFRGVILNVVEQRIFAALLNGQQLRDISSDFRIMFALHRLRSQWRKERADELFKDKMRPNASPFDDPYEDEPAEAAPHAAPSHPTPPVPTASQTAPPKTARPQPRPNGQPSPKPSEPVIDMGDILDQLTGNSTPADVFLRKKPASNPGNPAFPAFPGKPGKPIDPKAELKEVIKAVANM